MSTNGVNTCEDAEMAECDGEKVVTMMDVLKEQENFEEDANAVLGASDDKDCTYPKGYIKRQAIYACMTCCADARNDPTKRAGVCLACSLNCHENHELIELYTKRNFRCDCGNPKFNGHPCQFTPNKTEVNEDNVYNQNFVGMYCICHRPYPDPECTTEQEMIQCIICEDWLHSSHLDAVVPINEQYTEMICKSCMEKNEFLHDYSDLAVNKDNVDVDILNTSSEFNDVKCNGSPSIEMIEENIKADANIESTEKSISNNFSNEQVNKVAQCENITKETKEFAQCDTKPQSTTEQVHDASSGDQNHYKKEEQVITQTLEADVISSEKQNIIEKKDSLIARESPDDPSHSNKDVAISTHISELDDGVNETKDSIQPDSIVEELSDEQTHDKTEGVSLQTTENEDGIDEKEDSIKSKDPTLPDLLVAEESSNDQMHSNKEEHDSMQFTKEEMITNDEQDCSKNDDPTQADKLETDKKTDEIKSLADSNQENNENEEEIQSSLSNKMPSESTDKPDNRSQEQVEEDLLLADPVEADQGNVKDIDVSNAPSTNVTSNTSSDETAVENKPDPEMMETSESKANLEINKNLENGHESVTTSEQTEEMTEDEPTSTNREEKISADILINENCTHSTENKDILKDDTKDISNDDIDLPDKTAIEADILKRKLSNEGDNDDSKTKKPKLSENQCVKPRGVKKVYQGATFWASNFRHKLCTCNECLSMYKDLSILFLIDPDDTVTAYERLGKEKTDGESLSQYEKGMAALSSLGRVQQINALTEYTKMRDKLLEFLKSFKDRKVIVKEEDIKAFFADMKPVREPDGVYFCR